jgi:hypothetical protein
VRPPFERAVQKLVPRLTAVRGTDDVRKLDAVLVESRSGGREVAVPVVALPRRGDREHRVFTEEPVERDAKLTGLVGG